MKPKPLTIATLALIAVLAVTSAISVSVAIQRGRAIGTIAIEKTTAAAAEKAKKEAADEIANTPAADLVAHSPRADDLAGARDDLAGAAEQRLRDRVNSILLGGGSPPAH